MKRLILLFTLLLASLPLVAQVAVKGTVTSATDGEPVIGASVFEKGTMNGTVCSVDGTYSIT